MISRKYKQLIAWIHFLES